MARWGDGYITDVPYTSGFYRELTPSWLAFVALLGGQRPPDLSRPFRWAELGCGHGLTANCVAALHPNAEVWAFDFNPAHIEAARRLADAAGLTNVQFRETSFADLARGDDLPMFDFIVTHGVLSWVSAAARDDMRTIIDRHLLPGGLLYVSYNTPTGWDAMPPLQYLMRQMAKGMNRRSDQVFPTILDTLDRMVAGNAGFFRRNPEMAARLKRLRDTDPRYAAHEYLNENWQSLMFAEVADFLAGAKCEFVASATLPDNFDYASVPEAMRPLLREAPDQRMRETLRDFGAAQSFRRDVYRRGLAPLSGAQQLRHANALRIVPVAPRPEGGFRFPSSIGEMGGNMEIYGPVLDHLYAHGGLDFAAARDAGAAAPRSLALTLEVMTMIVGAGLAHFAAPAGTVEAAGVSAAGFNKAISEFNLAGGDMSLLVAPKAATAIGAQLLETFCRPQLAQARIADPASLAPVLRDALGATGRYLLRDGKPAADAAMEQEILAENIARLTGPQWPIRRALGVYD